MRCNNYKGATEELNKIIVQPAMIKGEKKLSWVFRYKTKDVTKNYSLMESLALLKENVQMNGFWQTTLFTNSHDFVFEYRKNGKSFFKELPATKTPHEKLGHDRQKERLISAQSKYLQLLGITSSNQKVFQKSEKKFKQINHYIEVLKPTLENLIDKEKIRILDMGCGKGYLTFALYDYVANKMGMDVEVTGVEMRKELVESCNEIAQDCGFSKLKFEAGTIGSYKIKEKPDLLIALHACDTATDEAIYQGIIGNSKSIIVAPCCHQQIRKEIEKSQWSNHPVLKFGIFMEREAEVVTDAIRSLILQIHGYKTKIIEFISDNHTPKNVMIMASYSGVPKEVGRLQTQLEQIKDQYKIGCHHLERILEPSNP